MEEKVLKENEAEPKEVTAKSEDGEAFASKYTPFQRVMAKIAIGLLLSLTVTDFVLAICGAPSNIVMLFIVLTIFIPIVLYFFLLMVKKGGRRDKKSSKK